MVKEVSVLAFCTLNRDYNHPTFAAKKCENNLKTDAALRANEIVNQETAVGTGFIQLRVCCNDRTDRKRSFSLDRFIRTGKLMTCNPVLPRNSDETDPNCFENRSNLND